VSNRERRIHAGELIALVEDLEAHISIHQRRSPPVAGSAAKRKAHIAILSGDPKIGMPMPVRSSTTRIRTVLATRSHGPSDA
jgi:hypothetical protein